jgi:hypothetical protein
MWVNLGQAACAQAAEVCKVQSKSIIHLALQLALRNSNIPTTLVGMTLNIRNKVYSLVGNEEDQILEMAT